MAPPETTPVGATVTTSVGAPESAAPPLKRPDQACAFVIFGASGDLTGRKLIPALYNLACEDLLPREFATIGFAVTPMTDESFREKMRPWTKDSSEVILYRPRLRDAFAPSLHYITADFESPEGYQTLKERLAELDHEHGCGGNRLFYLATSPAFFGTIVEKLHEHGLVTPNAEGEAWTRIVIEKPFGTDLQTAEKLNETIHRVVDEKQVYRIDHYLGKETVQNILAFRFANSIIEPIWNQHYVDYVQITAAETLGVEHRGGYYDRAGALRDMFQNHLFQLMALVAMEPPVHYDGRIVRDRKADVLGSVVPFDLDTLAEQAVRGQYGPGVMDGHPVPGYCDEEAVAPDSRTETFAALKLSIDNWRWAGVPFYLRSGKRMRRKLTQIVIGFKRVPHLFFTSTAQDNIEPNVLTIRIQPDEGISLQLGAKTPGPDMHVCQMQMNFSYSAAFGEFPATAYETLLLDVMEGDPTLFIRGDAVALSWEILAPVLNAWADPNSGQPLPQYAAGSWGPKEADELLARSGHAWRGDVSQSPYHP